MDLSRLLRPLVTVNHVSPNYYGGLRSVFSYLPPVLLAIGTGHLLEGTIAAISGQIVALADAGGSFPRRLGQTFGAL